MVFTRENDNKDVLQSLFQGYFLNKSVKKQSVATYENQNAIKSHARLTCSTLQIQ